jgi:xylitol oxidase
MNAAALTNWAGSVAFSAAEVSHPGSVEQLQEIIRKARKIRAVGSRHSFNRIADTTGTQVSLERLNRVVSLDRAANTVTVEAGMKYGDLARYLDGNGYALPNLASVLQITVAGACATATHGSGVKNGNLATAVSAIEFVNADGEVVALTRERDGDRFRGAVVGLGALGVVTTLTFDLQPRFEVAQVVYRNMPLSELQDNFTAIMSSGYSVSMFTDWRRKNINQVWIKTRLGASTGKPESPDFFGARLATRNMHTMDDELAGPCTEQMGVPGSWCERLPHFRMEFNPDSGQELQSEYFVPIDDAFEAITALEALHEQVTPHLFISEIRTVAADQLWMSPCRNRASVALHMTWRPEWKEVMLLLPLIEQALAPFNAVPHWGKLFTIPPRQLQSGYDKLASFKELAGLYDQKGKFRNDFLERNIFGDGAQR